MFENLLPILAVDENWIYFIVVGIAIVASVIGNIVKEAKQRQEQREQRERRTATRPPAGGEQPDQATPSRLDEMAERRRRQLQELAQRRKGAESRSLPGTGPAVSNDPTNLTAAQRAERERARAAYERRAAQLRGQRERQVTPPQGAAGARRKLTRRQPHVEPRHLPPPTGTPLEGRQRLASDPGSHDSGSGVSTLESAPLSETVRPVEHVSSARTAAPRKRPSIAKLIGQRHSLRNAILLKEILDRPIALREDQER